MHDKLPNNVYPCSDYLYNWATGERWSYEEVARRDPDERLYITQRSDLPAPYMPKGRKWAKRWWRRALLCIVFLRAAKEAVAVAEADDAAERGRGAAEVDGEEAYGEAEEEAEELAEELTRYERRRRARLDSMEESPEMELAMLWGEKLGYDGWIEDAGQMDEREVLEGVLNSAEYEEIKQHFGHPEWGFFPEAFLLEEVMMRYGSGIMWRGFWTKEGVFLMGHGHNGKTEVQMMIKFGLGGVWACPIRSCKMLQPQRNSDPSKPMPEWKEHGGKRFSYCAEGEADEKTGEMRLSAPIILPKVGGELEAARLMRENGEPSSRWTSVLSIGGNVFPTMVGGNHSRVEGCMRSWQMPTTFVGASDYQRGKAGLPLASRQQYDQDHLKLKSDSNTPSQKMERAWRRGRRYRYAILKYLANWSELVRIREAVTRSVQAAITARKLPSQKQLLQEAEADADEAGEAVAERYDFVSILAPDTTADGDELGIDAEGWELCQRMMRRDFPLVPYQLRSVLELMDPSAVKSCWAQYTDMERHEEGTTPEEIFQKVFQFTNDPSDIMYKGERPPPGGFGRQVVQETMYTAFLSSEWNGGKAQIDYNCFSAILNGYIVNHVKGKSIDSQSKAATLTGTREKPLVQFKVKQGTFVKFVRLGPSMEEALAMQQIVIRAAARSEAEEAEARRREEASRLSEEDEARRLACDATLLEDWDVDPNLNISELNLLNKVFEALLETGKRHGQHRIRLERSHSITLVRLVELLWAGSALRGTEYIDKSEANADYWYALFAAYFGRSLREWLEELGFSFKDESLTTIDMLSEQLIGLTDGQPDTSPSDNTRAKRRADKCPAQGKRKKLTLDYGAAGSSRPADDGSESDSD